uniref:VWFA domain-containing protein n=1 Tax=Gadus morhua TaxID=8049 RepID=A0A8C5F7V6_GADMO
MEILGVSLLQPFCLAFNIDTADPSIYYGDENGFFGHKVLQVTAGEDKGILVTTPLQQNGSGTVCRYMKHTNSCFTPQGSRLFGWSIAEEPTRSRFTICSPSVAHECYDNSYLSGQCYQLDAKLESVLPSFKPAFQDCTKKTVDLVFLFDGSASMTRDEFNKNKDFIVDIMNSIKNTSIKVTKLFRSQPRKVFDFNDYHSGEATKLLRNERFMQSLTNTYQADKLFENQAAGASPDATKVLVIITDGDPSDRDRNGIVKKYNDKEIIRLVIGVKQVKLDNLYAIASEPKTSLWIKGSAECKCKVNDLLFDLQGALVLGSVGSKDWRGSLYERNGAEPGIHIEDPDMKHSSYMGYSVAAGEKDSVSLYFTGAPRYKHTGEVVVFRKTDNTWNVLQRVTGEQIGSYFGAELCLVDVQSDGHVDFLLVGAPMFHCPQEKREGQIYIYKLTKKLESVLNVTVPSRGRFGTTVSSLADLNGDGLRDVAVGAPWRTTSGAAYLGDRALYRSRITADPANARIRFFGQSVDGSADLGEDGLADLVVGSRGAVVVLRSKPVVNVKARLHFEPAEISTASIQCPNTKTGAALPMVVLTVCFDLAEVTRSKTGTTTTGLNISYSLDVDPLNTVVRGFFSETGKRDLHQTVELATKHCFNHSVSMPFCVYDTLSSVVIRLNYTQHESEKAANILNADSATQTATEVPFEKNCRTNDTCIAELEVDFTFNAPTLVVVNHNNFNVTLRLTNKGDDSYNTKLYLFYPPGLSFSMLNRRPTLPSCKDLEGVLDETICGVNLPVYHSGTNATFQALFRVIDSYDWDSEISMTITGKSDNNNSTMSSMTKFIPVQYQVVLTVAVHEDTITYLKFTLEDQAPKEVVVIYEVNNLGLKELPVNVSITIPTKMEYDFEINNYRVYVEQNCLSNTTCTTMVCEPFSLARYSTTRIVLSGNVSFKNLEQLAKVCARMPPRYGETQDVMWRSAVEVTYDKRRYVQESVRVYALTMTALSFCTKIVY